MNIREVLIHQLSKPSHIVKITAENGERLQKTTKPMRYAYSLEEINKHFGSVDNLIFDLKKRGFRNTNFLFQRTYNAPEKATYHTMKEITVNLNNEVPLKTEISQVTPQIAHTSDVNFLAGTPSLNNPISLGALNAHVEAARAGDYKKRVYELEEDLKDSKSRVRILEEENNKLKLKAETIEERADLKVQRELLDKKSVFESEGFQKIAEGLGGLVPHLVPLLTKNNSVSALGNPQVDLSPMHQKAVELIQESSEQQASLVMYVLGNWDEELVKVISNYIEKTT